MFKGVITKQSIKSTQKFIDKLQPKINIILHDELPLPSVKLLKKLSTTVAQINALEEKISALSDDELRAKTVEFKSQYPAAVQKEKEDLKNLDDLYGKAESQEERDGLTIQIEKAEEEFFGEPFFEGVDKSLTPKQRDFIINAYIKWNNVKGPKTIAKTKAHFEKDSDDVLYGIARHYKGLEGWDYQSV